MEYKNISKMFSFLSYILKYPSESPGIKFRRKQCANWKYLNCCAFPHTILQLCVISHNYTQLYSESVNLRKCDE